MLVEFSIVPMGVGESISAHVAKVIDLVDRSGLKYRTHAMGTIVEGDWDSCLKLIRECHDLMRAVSTRVYTRIAIDDRADGKSTMERKLSSVREKLGREFKE